MRFIVLGGAGDMGSRAVEDLAVEPGVQRVTIADRAVDRAQALAARLKGRGAAIEVVGVDADDPPSLVRAMRGHTVAASALGPFFRFEEKLARAALEAGVDYVSVCDEWEPAEAVLDTLGPLAAERQRTIVTGLGASPGITNLVLRHLAGRLDRVIRGDVYCYQPLDAGGGEAVIRHMLHIMTGEIAVWRDGRRQFVRACSESRVVEFPRFGPIRLWNMGHSEPATVPRYFPGLREANFFMGYGRGARLIVQPAQWGLFRNEGITNAAVQVMERLAGLSKGGEPGWGALRGEVVGLKDGREVRMSACGVGPMREATGLPLSIGAQMLARGQLTARHGAFAPEGCLEAGIFLEKLTKKGIRIYEDLAMTRPLA